LKSNIKGHHGVRQGVFGGSVPSKFKLYDPADDQQQQRQQILDEKMSEERKVADEVLPI
jgi:hypothetical protein